MPLTSNSHFDLDPSKLGDTPSREPVPADWKIVAVFFCLVFLIYGAWTKETLNVLGFLELRLHSGEDCWLQSCFIAKYNLSPLKFISNMVFWGISGIVLSVQLVFSYLEYQQRRKNGIDAK